MEKNSWIVESVNDIKPTKLVEEDKTPKKSFEDDFKKIMQDTKDRKAVRDQIFAIRYKHKTGNYTG